jgi:hypothetical protein
MRSSGGSVVLAARTIVRYVVPLAIVTLVVVAPWAYVAFRSPWPRDLAGANLALARAFAIAGTAWIATFVLVGAAAPLVRSVAMGAPLSQPRAIGAAIGNTVRMVLPCLAASAAVLIGGLALVVPAFVLMAMLALTGASTERGMPAPLVESVAIVRERWKPVALAIGVMFVVDVALAFVAWKTVALPFSKKLKPAEWATYGSVARVVVMGVAVTAPLFATLLAAMASRSVRAAPPSA